MSTYTAFEGHLRLATGPIDEVALRVKARLAEADATVLVFEDATGQQLDLDLRGTDAEALERLKSHPWLVRGQEATEKRSGPGRPKLGVVSREVSLLPRHWDWLGDQPGGASVTLRKLVEERMRAGLGADRARKARDAAGKFMWTVAGDLPGFEEASRAFSRQDFDRFDALIAAWPADVRDHARRLVAVARDAENGDSRD